MPTKNGSMQTLKINPSYSSSNELMTLEITGDLIALAAITFKKNLLEKLSNKKSNLEINIQKLDSLDVTGLNALAMAHKVMKQKGLELMIVSKENSPAAEFLQLTKFSNYFHIKVA